MSRTNAEMEGMLESLRRVLDRRDMIGYVAARNARTLSDALREYVAFKDELIAKHGEEELDGEGEPTGRMFLSPASPGFGAFADELGPLARFEHEVGLLTLPYEDAIGQLSGSELLELDWMFED